MVTATIFHHKIHCIMNFFLIVITIAFIQIINDSMLSVLKLPDMQV